MFWSSLEVQTKQALNLSELKALEITIEPNKIYSFSDNEVYTTKNKLDFKEYGSRATWNNALSTDAEDYDASYGSSYQHDMSGRKSYSGHSGYPVKSSVLSSHASSETKERVYNTVQELEEQERLDNLAGQKLLFSNKFDVNKGK